MELPEFERMVTRLEAKSAQSPAGYHFNVALLATLGFAILALLVGTAGVSGVALVGLPFLLWYGGLHSLGALAALGKGLLLLALPLWMLVRSAVSAVFTRLPAPTGLELSRQQAPVLFAELDAMRRRMKGPRFHHVLISHDLNAGMVQRPLLGLVGPSRNYLILGLPLLDSLAPQEALAVVAHEYGHLAGSHSRFAGFIYRLRAGWSTIQQVSMQWQGPIGRFLQRIVGWYVPYFNAYSFVLARANEYQADAAAAELVGAKVAVNALKRTEVIGVHYGRYVQQTFKQASALPAPPEDFSARWAGMARQPQPDDLQRHLKRALQATGGLGDTHPPLRERLCALERAADARHDEPPSPIDGATAAEAWLGHSAPAVRQTLQQRWREGIAQHWEHRYEEGRKERQRLEQLQALASAGQDEHAERLRLRLACEDSAGFLDDVASYRAAYPASALGPFLEGVYRLSQKDESGLQCLERAIQLDASATKPACERAHEYLQERDDPRAEQFIERWKARDQWERSVQPQMDALDEAHELQPPDLSPEERATITSLLGIHHAGIERAFIARRVLPADATVRTYVLGLLLEPAPPRLELPEQIVARVAQCEGWPVHTIVITLQGKYKGLERKLQGLERAELVVGEKAPAGGAPG